MGVEALDAGVELELHASGRAGPLHQPIEERPAESA